MAAVAPMGVARLLAGLGRLLATLRQPGACPLWTSRVPPCLTVSSRSYMLATKKAFPAALFAVVLVQYSKPVWVSE